MNHFPSREAKDGYLHAVLSSESVSEDQRREYLLRSNFFHPEMFEGHTDHKGIHPLRQIEFEFFADKEEALQNNANFGDIFSMGISDKYVGKIDLIELCNLSTVEEIYAPDAKKPYKDLRQWLINHEIIERELTRSESERFFTFRKSCVSPIEPGVQQRIIVTRQRPLISGTMRNESQTWIDFVISKTMVFSVPEAMLMAIRDRYDWNGKSEDMPDAMKEHIENLLHEFNDPNDTIIQKIRTGYYLRAKRSDNV